MGSKVTIIGGGVNGICSGYYLQKAGYEVEIIDAAFDDDGTSYGNAGMIVPSHFIPMASPGIIAKGMKMMFDSTSPFYIRPRLDLRLAQWLWRFTRSCTKENVEQSQQLIWQYNELSKAEYRTIAEAEDFGFEFKEQGLLMLYKSKKSQEEEIEIGEKARELGIDVEVLDQSGVQSLNPNCQTEVRGGVYYPGDAHLYSNQFMEGMKSYLLASGVNFIAKKVKSGHVSKGQVSSLTMDDGSSLSIDQLVLTAGAWSWKIAKSLGIKVLLEDGKGYSITQKNIDIKPTIPSILTDEKVAITPMGADLRITGTLEISGLTTTINHKRVNAFLNAVPKYFPDVNITTDHDHAIWTGYRPLSFDGIPYVGRSQKVRNLIVATGHGMMGMSLGPATGKIVSQIISEQETTLNLEPMRIER